MVGRVALLGCLALLACHPGRGVAFRYGGAAPGASARPSSLAFLGGDVLIAGCHTGELALDPGVGPGEERGFVARLGPNGAPRWVRAMPGIVGCPRAFPDGAGGLFALWSRGAAGSRELRLAAFAGDGGVAWERGVGSGAVELAGLAVDPQGAFVIAVTGRGVFTLGGVEFRAGGDRVAVARFDREARPRWARLVGRGAGQVDALAVDPYDDTVLLADVTVEVGGRQVYRQSEGLAIIRLDPRGEIVQAVGVSATAELWGTGIAIDREDGVVFSGHSLGKVSLGERALVEEGAFVARVSNDGRVSWSRAIGAGCGAETIGIAVAPDGRILVGGRDYSTCTLDDFLGRPPAVRGGAAPESFLFLLSGRGERLDGISFGAGGNLTVLALAGGAFAAGGDMSGVFAPGRRRLATSGCAADAAGCSAPTAIWLWRSE